MALTDAAGRILRLNAQLAGMVRAPPAGRHRRPLVALFRADERQQAAREIGRALRASAPIDFCARLVGAEGQCLVRLTPTRTRAGRASGLVAEFVDACRDRQHVNVPMEAQNLRTVGEIAALLAHDFNSLLAAITTISELALARPALDEQSIDDFQDIAATGQRGARLVRRLMALGNSGAPVPRAVPLNETLRESARLLRRLLGKPGTIALEVDFAEPDGLVWIDPAELDRAMINLAINARDAMPAGGRLTLRTRRAGPQADAPWLIDVEDTGVGIAAADLPHVADAFFTTKRDRGGTGLGLASVAAIAREAEGSLEMASEPGRGTRATLRLPSAAGLPYAPPAPAPASSPASGEATVRQASIGTAAVTVPSANAPRVLIVEDEAALRRVLAKAFACEGWRVQTAACAEAALAALNQPGSDQPALLVTDMIMPELDGLALLRAARRQVPGLPAVLVSGDADPLLAEERSDPAIAFVSKPCPPRVLIGAARAVLGLPTTPDATPLTGSRSSHKVLAPTPSSNIRETKS
jgi:two-component system cell cycle sensor histidine kinase/response regulator CckA